MAGVLFFTRWIKKREIKTKILLIVFFFVPFIGGFYAGLLLSIPYYIYNLKQMMNRLYMVEKMMLSSTSKLCEWFKNGAVSFSLVH